MNTVCVLQARTNSTRLPGKVLADVCGQPMIARQMERMMRAQTLDDIVVAIPYGRQDDALSADCLARGWAIYRGPELDVLERYLGAAEAADADLIVRVTADCPLICPVVIDETVRFFRGGTFDFVANNLIPTFPHGLDVEVMTRGTLATAAARAKDPFDREHVTPWITRVGAGGSIFRIGNYGTAMGWSQYRLTVDWAEDLAVARFVFQHFGDNWFTTENVIQFLESRPDLIALNAKYRRPPMPAAGRA